MKIDIAIEINAPVERVWEAVEPIERHVDWMADAESITFTTEQTRGVGTAFDCATKVGPLRTTDRMVVTEWKPGRVMGIEHRGMFTGTGRFTLLSIKDGRCTEFEWAEELTFPWWMGGEIGAFFARPVLRSVWKRNLTRLKAIAEGR